ncbi:Uncharacterized protein FKW44_006892 [Caligus rogercresseyi]|uniref:Uncharacterized protein n=1 Tax=Caligus rogercresseyi TaxID=217165 RepID=A0A7T8QT51_CALRO|nr:Uncharacterized protein FKW44_006892 [Caligus rogercresseyi]
MRRSRNFALRTGVFVIGCLVLYSASSFFEDSEPGLRNRKLLQVDEDGDSLPNSTTTPSRPMKKALVTISFLMICLHINNSKWSRYSSHNRNPFMFYALALVCDDFFVPSLDIISEKASIS